MKPDEFFNQNGKSFFFEDAFELAKYAKERFPQKSEALIAAADEIADQRFSFMLRWDGVRLKSPVEFAGEIDWLFQPGDDPEWVYAFNRMTFWVTLGQAYALTRDEKYAKAFVGQMKHWIKNIKNTPKNQMAWRSIEVGFRLEFWLRAILYFKTSPELTEEAMELFVESITEQAETIMRLWNNFNLMSNWGVIANHGLFFAGMMLPETKRTREYIGEAVSRLTAEMKIQVYRDGTHWEQSPMYHHEVMHCFLDVALLAQRCGEKLPEEFIDSLYRMCRASMISAKPNHREPMMGDSDDIDIRNHLSKAAVVFKDCELMSQANMDPDFEAVWELGESGMELYQSLIPRKPKEIDFFLQDSGNIFMRTGWSENDVWAHFHCGPLGAGHGHADKLHLDIFALGEDVLVDSGRYSYVFDSNREYFKSQRAHNTVMVDGRELYICKDSWECEQLTRAVNQKFYTDNRYAYAEGGHLGYMGLSNGVFLNRRVIFLKPDIFVVADEYYSGGPHQYNQFYNFSEQGSLLKNDDKQWTFNGKNVQAEIRFVGAGLESEIIDTKVSREYNQYSESSGIKTCWQALGSGCVYTFIALSRKGEAKELKIEKLKVESSFKKTVFLDEEIEAFNIFFGKSKFTLTVAHKEYASPTDTFIAGGCVGFGSVVVFDPEPTVLSF